MKKLIFIAVLALFCAAPIHADAQQLKVETQHDMLSRMEQSVLLITGYTPQNQRFSGTGVVIKETETETVVLTARHVAREARTLVIWFNQKGHISTKTHLVFGTDAAIVWFPKIKGVKAIPLNLDSERGTVKSLTFGYWGGMKALTGAFGHTTRISIDRFSAPDYKLVAGLMPSTALIFPGFSGGALVNSKGHLIGINVILATGGKPMSYAVDIRYIWNNVVSLHKGNLVPYTTVKDYNLRGSDSNSWKRLAVEFKDIIKAGEEEINIMDLMIALNDDLSGDRHAFNPGSFKKNSKWIAPGNTITLSGKKWTIKASFIHGKEMKSAKAGRFGFGVKYIMIINEGYELIIALTEYKEPVKEAAKSASKKKTAPVVTPRRK